MADGFVRPQFKVKKRRLPFKELGRFQLKAQEEAKRVLELSVAIMKVELEGSMPDPADEILAASLQKTAEPLIDLLKTLGYDDYQSLHTQIPLREEQVLQKVVTDLDLRIQAKPYDIKRLKSVRQGAVRQLKSSQERLNGVRANFAQGCEDVKREAATLGYDWEVGDLWNLIQKGELAHV